VLEVVLDPQLAPAERLAFVLHDMFAVPFEQIAPIVGCSPTAARQLASRARRRVRGAATSPDADLSSQREVVEAFLAASRDGDFDALVAVLDPEVVLRADVGGVRAGASREVRGGRAVADTFSGRARFARPVLVNGAAGLVWAPRRRPRFVFATILEDDGPSSLAGRLFTELYGRNQVRRFSRYEKQSLLCEACKRRIVGRCP